jgi:diguanylate cyclase (GGDEF)-like protein
VVAAAVRQAPGGPGVEAVAAALFSTYPALRTAQIAPGGLVRTVFPPEAEGERLGPDLLRDPVLGAAAEHAIQRRGLAVAGPLPLPSQGRGLIALVPVFVPTRAGGEELWGMVAVTLDLRRLLTGARLDRLLQHGYHYELSTAAPGGRRRLTVARSTEMEIADPVRAQFPLAGGEWTLAVAPREGWRSPSQLLAQLVLVMVAAVIAGVSAHQLVREPEALRQEAEVRRRRLSEATRQLQAEVAQRLEAEQQRRHEATHDGLTGLPNRAAFGSQLQAALDFLRDRPGLRVAVLFVNLDRFKHVNDSLGPARADELLADVARRLEGCLRPGDALARVGGDEFAALLCNVEDSDAVRVVAARLLAQLQAPFSVAGRELFVPASIGIALSDGHGQADELLRDADTAVHHAKARGRGRAELFDPALQARASRRLDDETQLRRAIARSEFVAFYQPIVSMETGRIVGAEALVRWAHPQRGIVGPVEFMPLAEETGLVIWIDRWVLREAAQQVKSWQARFASDPPLSVSVNCSGHQLAQPLLADYVDEVLRETGLAATALKLEVTESVVMENAQVALETLQRLREMGVRLLVDDFGTGYSSLSYLDRFPFHTVKVDQSFVKGLKGTVTPIVRTILDLARSLGMDVIAEGIETADQMQALRDAECGYGQGYLFARPLAAADFESLLAAVPRW